MQSLGYFQRPYCSELLARESLGRRYLELLHLEDDLARTEEPVRYGRELKSQILHLAIEAYRREAIPRGRLLDVARMLDVPANRLLELADAARVGRG